MKSFLQTAPNWFPAWLLLFCGTAFFQPDWFVWFSGPWIVWGLAVIMLGMGVTIPRGAFAGVLHMPGAVGLGFVAQFTIMPLAGWSVAWLLGLPVEYAVGLILVACCPGGTASNVICFLARANVALSVIMTICSTLAAVLVTPWLTHLLAGQFLPVDGWGMVLTTLQVVVAPVLLGVFLNRHVPFLARPVSTVGPLLAVLVISMICASIVGQSRDDLARDGLLLLLAVFLLHSLGFLLGWLAAKLFRFPTDAARTISVEVGMQNSGLAAVLARTHFAANPLTAVPAAISSVIHSLIGSLLAAIWRRNPARNPQENADSPIPPVP